MEISIKYGNSFSALEQIFQESQEKACPPFSLIYE
jgi:hypothetical protein